MTDKSLITERSALPLRQIARDLLHTLLHTTERQIFIHQWFNYTSIFDVMKIRKKASDDIDQSSSIPISPCENQRAPASAADWLTKSHVMCYHVYVTMHGKVP